MGITATIVALAGAGVTSAFAESICEKVGKPDYAQFVRLGGFCVAGTTIVVQVASFLKALKSL